MRAAIIEKLKSFKAGLGHLRKDVRETATLKINRVKTRLDAETLAMQWLDEISGRLKEFKVPEQTIKDIDAMGESMNLLRQYSGGQNRKESYMRVLDAAYPKFDARFTFPIQRSPDVTKVDFDFRKLFPNLSDSQESEYMKEAIGCANEGYFRAAVVVGWCAAMNRIHSHVKELGITKINEALRAMRKAERGRFKQVKKDLSISALSEVQEITDRNLILLILWLDWIDVNQAERLFEHLNHRNQSAHPGKAPVGKDLLNHFFPGVREIIFNNPKIKR